MAFPLLQCLEQFEARLRLLPADLEPLVSVVAALLLQFQVDLGLLSGTQALVKLHIWSSHKYSGPFESSSQNFPQTCLGPNVLAFQTSSLWRLYDDANVSNETLFLFQSFDSSNDNLANHNSQRCLCSPPCDDDDEAAHRKNDDQKIFGAKVAAHPKSGDLLRVDGAFEMTIGDHNRAFDLSNDVSPHAYETAIFFRHVNAVVALFACAHDVYEPMAD